MSTICAISTPPGVGGIAVIRISGPEAFTIVDSVFRPIGKKTLIDAPTYSILYGQIVENEQSIDDVLLSLFRAPHSYTGEETIEISCHGSLYIQQAILTLLLRQGATMAQPGEFTQRAFLNGKLDLSQAEGVADLIASTSAASHRLALSQMRGGFSRQLAMLRGELIHFASLIELELDFSEEDVEFADRTEVRQLAEKIQTIITRLANSFQTGNAIKNGIPVAIVGETNAGKSTLLNALLNEERAIVSDIHGTTRDVIEDTISIRGINFRFIDTAGIRETADTIESLGIDRTYQKMQQASIVLWLFDASHPIEILREMKKHIFSMTDPEKILPVANKSDLVTPSALNQLSQELELTSLLSLSAKQGEGIQTLEDRLIEAAHLQTISDQEVIVTNARHYESLLRASESMVRVIEGLSTNLSGDFVAMDIREVIHHLGTITGDVSDQDILKNIFANFCIGK